MTRVSIIIPCFNSAPYLRRTLDSALAQSHPDTEVIVVDDCSTDDSPAIARSYGPRVRITTQENRGLAAARNRGVADATGELLQFLDADDVLMADKVAAQAAFLDGHPDVGVVYSDLHIFDGWDESATRPEHWRQHRAWPDVVEALCTLNPLAVHSAIMRRAVFDRVGGFPTSFRHGGEDWAFWIDAALGGTRFAYLPGPLALYRQRPGSLTSSGARNRAWERTVLSHLAARLADEKAATPRRRAALHVGWLRLAVEHARHGALDEARETLRTAPPLPSSPEVDAPGYAWPSPAAPLHLLHAHAGLHLANLVDDASRAAFARVGDPGTALREARELDPRDAANAGILGGLLVLARRRTPLDRAWLSTLADTWLAHPPAPTLPLYALADALDDAGDDEKSTRVHALLTTLDPDAVRPRARLGSRCVRNGHPLEGARHLLHAGASLVKRRARRR